VFNLFFAKLNSPMGCTSLVFQSLSVHFEARLHRLLCLRTKLLSKYFAIAANIVNFELVLRPNTPDSFINR